MGFTIAEVPSPYYFPLVASLNVINHEHKPHGNICKHGRAQEEIRTSLICLGDWAGRILDPTLFPRTPSTISSGERADSYSYSPFHVYNISVINNDKIKINTKKNIFCWYTFGTVQNVFITFFLRRSR